jgi:TRAP-type mannitol/chloroaromatic compound transport system permease small subunit
MDRLARLADAIDRLVGGIGRLAAWLVLPVVAALFCQVPLREFVHVGYVTSNDIGQILHAAIVVIGIPYVLQQGRHVRVDIFYQRFAPRRRALVDLLGTALFVLPWLAILGWYGWPIARNSLALREAFPDTWTPGYFLIKALLLLFVLLLGAQALASLARAVLALAGGALAGPARKDAT